MLSAVSEWLFDPAGLSPHGFCLTWEPGLIWLHALSDLAVAVAYLTIPVALAILARRRPDLRPRSAIWLFVAFIALCGLGHLLDLLTLWVPAYGVQGVVKVLIALVSVTGAIVLWRMLPQAMTWPTPGQLRRAERELAEARERIAFELSPVAKCMLGPDDRIVDVSESWLALFGYSREAVVGQPLGAFQEAGCEGWTEVERARLAAGALHHREMTFQRRDGSRLEAMVSARRQPGGSAVVCAVVDITARKRAEAALRSTEDRMQQMQKMEAIGRLAAGVAHDFNNILQAVVGALEAAMEEVEDEAPARPYLEIALRASGRGSSLTQHLLSYARKQMLQPSAIDLATFMTELRGLLERTLGPKVAVQVDVAPGASVQADPGQLETALLNLAINAVHAMPKGGTLRLAAREEDEAGQRRIVLTVTDTGTGMDAETLARAVDPFFTTKGVEGTGLGLSMVQGFTEQSGGRLRLISVVGEGTTVELSLPAAVRPTLPPQVPLRRLGPGRLMLVDDAPEVVLITAAFFEKCGFEVLRAENAEHALALLAERGPVDALVTDYVMPGMSGVELIMAARHLQPGLPALLITGYAEMPAGAGLPPGVSVLCKPFQRKELSEHLARMLHAAEAPAA